LELDAETCNAPFVCHTLLLHCKKKQTAVKTLDMH
jgi:hypothetical protein